MRTSRSRGRRLEGKKPDWILDSIHFVSQYWETPGALISMSNSAWYGQILHGINYKFIRKCGVTYHKLGGYAWMLREEFDTLREAKKEAGLPLDILHEVPMRQIPSVMAIEVISLKKL